MQTQDSGLANNKKKEKHNKDKDRQDTYSLPKILNKTSENIISNKNTNTHDKMINVNMEDKLDVIVNADNRSNPNTTQTKFQKETTI